MSKKTLQQQWQEVCNDYLRAFCKRHEYAYDPKDWIGTGVENMTEHSSTNISQEDMTKLALVEQDMTILRQKLKRKPFALSVS